MCELPIHVSAAPHLTKALHTYRAQLVLIEYKYIKYSCSKFKNTISKFVYLNFSINAHFLAGAYFHNLCLDLTQVHSFVKLVKIQLQLERKIVNVLCLLRKNYAL